MKHFGECDFDYCKFCKPIDDPRIISVCTYHAKKCYADEHPDKCVDKEEEKKLEKARQFYNAVNL